LRNASQRGDYYANANADEAAALLFRAARVCIPQTADDDDDDAITTTITRMKMDYD